MQSTPLRELADVTPVTFYCPPSLGGDVAVTFYDAAGTEVAGGTVDITASFPTNSYSGAVRDGERLPATELAAQVPTATVAAGVATALGFGASGKTAVKLTPSAIVPPGGATLYRIALDRPQKRAPQ